MLKLPFYIDYFNVCEERLSYTNLHMDGNLAINYKHQIIIKIILDFFLSLVPLGINYRQFKDL